MATELPKRRVSKCPSGLSPQRRRAGRTFLPMQHRDPVCPTALVLASPYEGEDDDFVVICTNRAVLDVGLLSLHDLRADSLIRPIASKSVIQLLSNHCHFNNHIFSAYFFYLARARGPNYNGNASRLFSLFCI